MDPMVPYHQLSRIIAWYHFPVVVDSRITQRNTVSSRSIDSAPRFRNFPLLIPFALSGQRHSLISYYYLRNTTYYVQ